MVVGDVNTPVRALRQCLFDGLFHTLRSEGQSDHFPAVLFLKAEGLLQSVAIGLVHLEADVRFLDPVSGNRQRRIFCRHLLDAHDNVHGSFLPSGPAEWDVRHPEWSENSNKPGRSTENITRNRTRRRARRRLLAGPALENQSSVGATKPKEFDNT